MFGRNTAVFGIYPTDHGADAAVDALRTRGFRTTDVSVLSPFVATLPGTGADGTMSGATGVLIGLGIPARQERRYEGRMRKGGFLLSVHTDDREWATRGKRILEQTGAEDICWTGETEVGNTNRPSGLVEHVAPGKGHLRGEYLEIPGHRVTARHRQRASLGSTPARATRC